ncbi:membrane protein DedA with SNARE-associated domain [Tumebacillus sp. BK434]|uniref:DedA family protein n=1 Tax=Tumebacillus sp. BK434 TaxID=2512169 RepID=UPI00104C9324|nr:DedA family protein [Tumebacillus sp. BK434]TCP55394.1 membrane protein DedA with SNARE-associated domain [Tumebacillus sp. BK434]
MLHALIEWLSAIATGLIETFGHWGIFWGMLIESACIPLPSEVIMLYGGFMAEKGLLSFWPVFWAGVFGNLVGSVLTYWIGASGGRTFLMKYGKYILINEKHIHTADRWFAKYGDWAAFFGRNLPVIRTFISLPAGIAKMNFWKFTVYTFVGCLPWNLALTWAGFKLGTNWHAVEPYIKPFSYGILGLIILAVLWFVYKNLRTRFAH